MTITASVYVDGQWLADGSGPDSADPVVLSGLSVSWGRATTVDQPEPSTASFDLLDPPGESSFLDLLYVGATVTVTAAGDVPAPATLPVNRDPSFEAAPLGSDPFGHYGWTGTSVVVNDRAATGGQSARLTFDRAGGGLLAGAWIPPAPYDDVDPSAWDDIPKMQEGEHWSATAAVQSPIGGSFGLFLYGYPSPKTTSAANYPYDTGGRVNGGTGADVPQSWQTMTIPTRTITPGAANKWAGLLIRIQVAAWNTIGPMIGGQPNPIAWTDVAGSWDDWATGYVDDVHILAPASADVVHRDVTVFAGRITDLDAGYDTAAGGVICSVTATDFTADLAQRDVGAEPWPAEPLTARFGRILTAAGVAVRYTIASTLGAFVVSWLDVDRQQAWPLLADLATSVDGILWSAVHSLTGPYLWLADPRTSATLYVLTMGDAGLVVIQPTAAAGNAIELDACDVLLDPVVFRQSVSDLSTRVAVTWMEQTVDDAGQPAPTERTDTIIDAAAEAAHGTRRVAVSTLLTNAVDADRVAAAILGRLRVSSWRVGGLNWATALSEMDDGDRTGRALDLLDGVRRLGVAILLTNLPDWVPSGADTLPLLLQGGTYTFDAGQWELDLTTSSAAAQGASLPWTDLDPSWSWNEFDPAIAWTDLAGVGT
jgi:hypothetical protein